MNKIARIILAGIMVLATTLSSTVLAASANSRYDNMLFMAISKKNFTMAQLAINNGADVNCTNIDDINPLHAAIGQRDLNMVNLLLAKGANPNTRCELSPLEYAIALNENLIGTSLLTYGADPNSVDKYNNPIIFYATHQYVHSSAVGDTQFYTTLIKKGANLQTTMADGTNLLMLIAGKYLAGNATKDIATMKYLIAKGVDPNYSVYDENHDKDITALDIAIRQNATPIVNFLLPLTKKQ